MKDGAIMPDIIVQRRKIAIGDVRVYPRDAVGLRSQSCLRERTPKHMGTRSAHLVCSCVFPGDCFGKHDTIHSRHH